MTLQELAPLLEAAPIYPGCYLLGKDGGSECYVILWESSLNRWVVFYSERGLRTNQIAFVSESEACEYFLKTVLREAAWPRK